LTVNEPEKDEPSQFKTIRTDKVSAFDLFDGSEISDKDNAAVKI